MDTESKTFILVVEDTIVRVTEYIVKANNPAHAEEKIKAGSWMFESAGETVETIESAVVRVETIEDIE